MYSIMFPTKTHLSASFLQISTKLTLLKRYVTNVLIFEGSCERQMSLNFANPSSSTRNMAMYANTVYSVISDLNTRDELSA